MVARERQSERDDNARRAKAIEENGCEAPLVYIAISPTPARAEHQGLVEETNRLIAARCATSPRLTFVDTASALLDAQGRPDPRWFRGDGLHLNSEGYALWAAALRPVVWELYEARRPQAHGPRRRQAPAHLRTSDSAGTLPSSGAASVLSRPIGFLTP